MTGETKEWAWEAGVLYENGVPIATATRECSVLHAQMMMGAPAMATALQHADDALSAQGYTRESMARVLIRGALLRAGVQPS